MIKHLKWMPVSGTSIMYRIAMIITKRINRSKAIRDKNQLKMISSYYKKGKHNLRCEQSVDTINTRDKNLIIGSKEYNILSG